MSDEFEIARGSKQSGPLSSLLFNSVLQSAMEKDIGTWNENGMGIKLGDEKRDGISNLRFADDVLMMANSLKPLKRMMTAFTRSTEAQGLEIHPDKTIILANYKAHRLKEIEIDGIHVEILPPEGKVQYLGQMITFMNQGTTEVQHRSRCAWSAGCQTSTGIDIQVLLAPTQVASL